MPLSTNAPFSEFGHSMVLRDLEQIYLLLGGKGSGSPGDGATQDQDAGVSQETGDGGSIPDLSRFATRDYVNSAIGNIPSASYPISIANGGTGKSTAATALDALNGSPLGSAQTIYLTGSGTYTVPSDVYGIAVIVVGGGGGRPTTQSVTGTELFVASSSGGSATQSYQMEASGGGGGSGGVALAFIPVTPGDTFPYVVGSGGGVDTDGGYSLFGTVVGYGGKAGGLPTSSGVYIMSGIGGVGGSASINLYQGVACNGNNGQNGVMSGITPTPGSGGTGVVINSTLFGNGGAYTGPSTYSLAGNGLVLIFY